MTDKAKLPDITSNSKITGSHNLRWVGMEAIALPMRIEGIDGENLPVTAMSDIFVSLDDSNAKGIHMSRLYLLLKEALANRQIDSGTVFSLLMSVITSQGGISQSAKIRIRFDLPLKKEALLSGETGFQSYPVELHASIREGVQSIKLELSIPYSSTCPCSAALSRQLMAQAIDEGFKGEMVDKASLLQWVQSEQGSVATPHSQRSFAYVSVQLSNGLIPNIADLVHQFEHTLGTPVQTAVKREDEQAFAKLNADNLMFCEDAARKLKLCLEAMEFIEDYWFKVEHQESLHAHNAVVIDQKYA
jgi:GTP cyclohydrolase I